MVFREVIQRGTFQVDHANDASLVSQRNRNFRTRFRMDGNVTRILCDIIDSDRLIQQSSDTDQAFSKRYRQLAVFAFVGSNDGFDLQQSGTLVELKDRE